MTADRRGLPIVEQPIVMVSPAVAFQIARPLRRVLRAAQRDGVAVSPHTMRTVEALEVAAEWWVKDQEARTSDRGRSGSAAAEGSCITETVMGVSEVAGLLGCTERNVTDLARRGAIPAQKVGGRGAWVFDRFDVEEYLDVRGR